MSPALVSAAEEVENERARSRDRMRASRANESPVATQERQQAQRDRDRVQRARARHRASHKARNARAVLQLEVAVDPCPVLGDMQACEHCGAKLFKDEMNRRVCCKKGNVLIEKLPEPPPRLKALLEGTDADAKTFKKYIKQINQALSLSSLTVKHARPAWATSSYNPSIVISGQSYYNLGPAMATPGDTPRNAQVRDTLLN